MGYKTITYACDTTGVATVCLSRVSVNNAFDDDMIAELITCFKHIDGDEHVRVVVLRAEGKFFCAGADLNWMHRMAKNSEAENLRDAQQLALLLQTLNSLSKPTICMVQGSAYGGGLGLIACCDVVIAMDNAQFCFSEVKLGLIPATISPYVIRAIGQRQTRRYFLTAEVFNGVAAKAMGLVHELTNSMQAFDLKLHSLVKQLLNNGPQAIKATKRLIAHIENHALDDALINYTAQTIAQVRVTKEAQEGVDAFLNKRKPPWCGTENE